MTMRWAALLLLSGCGIKQLLPEGPALSPWQRTLTMPIGVPANVTYTSEPAVPFPVMPVIAWGAAYDLDLVLVDGKGPWDMHEYARLQTPSGPLWLAKDARIGTLEQTVVADLPDIQSWLPELPVVRRSGRVDVQDRSTAKRLDLTLSYENVDGKPVVAHYVGAPPETAESKRNGSTMGHSRRTILAVLDLSHRSLGNGTVTIDGKKIPAYKLAGLVPFRAALLQAQTGLATGSFEEVDLDGRLVTHWASNVESGWAGAWDGDHFLVRQESPQRTLVYDYLSDRDKVDRLEWVGATVFQYGRATPVGHIEVSPALPDLRRRFEGHHRSRYVIDANGQEGHATGWMDAWWEAEGPRVALIPEAPWWTVDRPMLTSIHYENGRARVDVVRTPTTARTGSGGRNRSGHQE
jgi:hypothetical protein